MCKRPDAAEKLQDVFYDRTNGGADKREMITGGAYQGKAAYGKKAYPEILWKNGAELSREELFKTEGGLNFHEFIRKEMKAGRDTEDLAPELIQRNPEVILVSDEVGYGVVPIDAFDRAYRERVGRICTELASYSKKVVRVVCGIGTVIKND